MAFKQAAMTKIANLLNLVNVTDTMPGMWVYATADTMAQTTAANYFNGALGLVVNSVIDVFTSTGKATLLVTGVTAAGVVTVSNTTTMARGSAVTVTAVDTIVTGLPGPLLGVVVTSNDDASLGNALQTASIGNQAGAPASGSFYLKSWKMTSNANPTPIAATAFGVKINWIAWSQPGV